MTAAAPSLEQQVDDLVARLTLDEKLGLLDGDTDFWPGMLDTARHDAYHRHPWPAGRVPRLGIEGIHFVDGPRGVVLHGGATTFPAALTRGASWDVDLERRVGEAIGREARTYGANLWGGVCVNLLRHPGWGRAQETYGEDPVHVGAMGAAAVTGAQRHVIACVKHFALNSIDSARFRLDVRATPRVLHEVYLPHFRDCVDAGAMAVMSAYNSVNGEWCGQSPALLTDVLKQRWGFSGFVLTDFIFGLRDAGAAMRAGQDLEMPFRMVLAGSLASLVRSGEVSTDRVDDAARRLLRAQLGVPAGSYPPGARGTAEHRALAREAAAKGIVVLKNDDDALPLTGVSTVAVVGRLAVVPNLGDRGSSDTRPSHVVTPLEGLKAAGACDVTYSTGEDQQAAAALAAQADAAVVVVGLDWHDEGENIDPGDIASFARHVPPPAAWASRAWRPAQRLLERAMARAARRLAADFTAGDRTLLRLDPRQEALVRAVAAANPRTVVVLMGGGAVIVESWRHHVAGIVLLGYPGQQGGGALADVLVGRVTPAGRLPFTVPTQHGHLPAFDPRARSITYDLWHGYRLLRRDGNAAAFPFGFGLSYTTFATSDVSAAVDAATSSVRVSATVTNTGTRPGAEVVQVYLEPPGQAVERPSRVLAGFARVELDPGESRPVVVDVPWRRLAYFDESQDAFVLESGSHRLVLARHAEHDPAPAVEVELPALVVGP